MPRPCRTRARAARELDLEGGGADPRSIDGRVVRDRAVAELRRAERAPGSEPALEVAADGRGDGGGDPAARGGCGRGERAFRCASFDTTPATWRFAARAGG